MTETARLPYTVDPDLRLPFTVLPRITENMAVSLAFAFHPCPGAGADPVLALAHGVPCEIQIAPVYLRATQQAGVITYDLVECRCPDPRQGVICLTDLTAAEHGRLSLRVN